LTILADTYTVPRNLASNVRDRTLTDREAIVGIDDFFRTERSPEGFQSSSPRKTKVRDDIAQRLRRICSDLPETEFQQLVDEMAERQLKGEHRTSDW